MRLLLATVERNEAWLRLHERPRWRKWGRSLAQHCGYPAATAWLELVYLTHYLVTFPVTQGERSGVIRSLISGHDGSFSRIEVSEERFVTATDHECLLPATTTDITPLLDDARQGTVMALLNAPGWSTTRACLGEPTLEPIGYPVWAYYFRRRKGILDVRTLDGWTGRLGTARIKLALISALAAAESSRQP